MIVCFSVCLELQGLGRAGGGGDVIETQLKLGSQKWKAKCRVSRHEQTWQEEDVGGVMNVGVALRSLLVFFFPADYFPGEGDGRAVCKGRGGQKDTGQRAPGQHEVSDQRILLLLPFSKCPGHVARACGCDVMLLL